MKVIIAPDSFKGSLTSRMAADAMASGVRRVFPSAQIQSIPIADGGEGTVDAWINACGGTRHFHRVTGPLGIPMDAAFGVLRDGTAVVETAAASGLTLVPPALRNPLNTTTYGTGELIRHALDDGASHVVVGLGGSATNDGGAGALQALGVRFYDACGSEITSIITGALVDRIDHVERTERRERIDVVIASDVVNPLIGPTGASAVFGPQKGATPEMVKVLDAALAHLADVYERDLGLNVSSLPGSGAAGGLGAALQAYFGAKSESGVDMLLDVANFDAVVADADVVITGEGSIDVQTLQGKAVLGVLQRTLSISNAKTVAIGGRVDADAKRQLLNAGVDVVEAAVDPQAPIDEAMSRATELVELAAQRAVARIRSRILFRQLVRDHKNIDPA